MKNNVSLKGGYGVEKKQSIETIQESWLLEWKKNCQFCISTIFLHYELSNVSSNWRQSKYKVTFFDMIFPKTGGSNVVVSR